jgi:hypothetical protein
MGVVARAVRVRSRRVGVFAAAVVLGASAQGAGQAGPPLQRAGRGRTMADALASPRGPVTVALGATGGTAHDRALLEEALADAIGQNPGLQLAGARAGGARPAIVLTANVRALVVSHGPGGALARCDVGVVVVDGGGAVRAMLDVRRVVHGDAGSSDDALARTALRSAAHGTLRDLVAQVLR